jgi:hypothetical protein
MSTETNIHSKLITDAARKILRPIGLFQKGRSRTWLGDHGWWLDVVEFQPTDWGKGSYLNVSCMWLWNVKPVISFDVGTIREESLHRFENEDQFAEVAAILARNAEHKVLDYRRLFHSVGAVSDFFLPCTEMMGWSAFNAAIAHGLSSRRDAALQLFAQCFNSVDVSIEWQKKVQEDAQYLASLINEPERFRREIAARVLRTRELHKLPTVPIDFEASALMVDGKANF